MKKLLVSILMLLLLSVFSVPVYAAGKARIGARSQLEKDAIAILHVSEKQCSSDNWCDPKIQKIIGNYATVLFVCTKKDKQCENDVAYLMKTKGTWIIKEQGTGIFPDDLIQDGFPSHIAEKLCSY